MRKRILSTVLIIALVASMSFQSQAVFAYSNGKFGSVPLDDVMSAARNNYANTGLTSNGLAAMMLSMTWPETADNILTNTPSPMTLSRGDYGYANLWGDAQKSTTYKYVRAHFNPGAGVFQMDSAGLGANIGLKEAIYTSDSAPIVAASIARKYKSASGTAAQKRAAAWPCYWAVAPCSLDVRLSLTQQVLKAM